MLTSAGALYKDHISKDNNAVRCFNRLVYRFLQQSYHCRVFEMKMFQHFYIQGVQLWRRSEVIVNKVDNKKHLGDISLRIAVFS